MGRIGFFWRIQNSEFNECANSITWCRTCSRRSSASSRNPYHDRERKFHSWPYRLSEKFLARGSAERPSLAKGVRKLRGHAPKSRSSFRQLFRGKPAKDRDGARTGCPSENADRRRTHSR